MEAIETAPPLSDREIIERLTKLEAGQSHLVAKIDANTAAIAQLRQDMNAQFDRLSQLMLGILGAFTVLVAVTIGFALWDRRTMMRPLEGRVKSLEDDLAVSQPRAQALLEALRNLSQRDPELASVLKSFNL